MSASIALPTLTVVTRKAACLNQAKVNRKANHSSRAIDEGTGSINEARNVRKASSGGARWSDCTLRLKATSPGQGDGWAWMIIDATRMMAKPIPQQVIPVILRLSRLRRFP